MSFLSNIKFQYNQKILQDYIKSGNFNDFFKHIEKHRENKKLYTQLLFTLGIDVLKKIDENFFVSNLTWLNSFLEEDLKDLEKFLNFYFKIIKKFLY